MAYDCRWEAAEGVDWAEQGGPLFDGGTDGLISVCSYRAVAPAALVCRRFRDAFYDAIRGLHVGFYQTAGGGTGARAAAATPFSSSVAATATKRAVVERSSHLVGLLPKLRHLRALDCRIEDGTTVPPWVPPLVTRGMLACTAQLPALKALCVGRDALTPALLSLFSGTALECHSHPPSSPSPPPRRLPRQLRKDGGGASATHRSGLLRRSHVYPK